jgi:hypothetical protein
MSALAKRPQCQCGAYMEIRQPYGGYTPEQKFCGVWYDHPAISSALSFGHTTTVLYPSAELLEQLGEPA